MSEKLTSEQLVTMILGAAEEIKANHEMLSKLDSVVGDGDHGTAMLRVVSAISQVIGDNKDGPIKPMLERLGWAVMGVDAGSTGPLVGSFFSGMAEALEDDAQLDSAALSSMFAAGQEKVQTITTAKPGDKTMIDALAPAVESFVAAINKGQSVSAALQQAAMASAQGAEATKQMQAKFGRAKNLGERTIGHADPGATSVSLIFQGFHKAFCG